MTSAGIDQLYDPPVRLAAWFLALVPLTALAADDLTPLSDEFNDASTLPQWKRIYVVEGWNANQLQVQDINTTRPGHMIMIPFTSTWYNDYRGELTFKEVTGDFVATADVEVTNRFGNGAPGSQFSLGGIMVRAPRQITPATWRPGGEDYVFLSIGAANQIGRFQFEVKTTLNSNSILDITSADDGHATIQWARLGANFIALRKVAGVWSVHRRYSRPDMPQTLQVGMTVYTDYPTASMFAPLAHNSMVIHIGNPDLVAAFDYFRFERPRVPPALLGADFSTVSDLDLLSFLGANGNPAPRQRAAHH